MRVFGKEFRFFKHDLHGPVPLMMHPRLHWLRCIDLSLRPLLLKVAGREYNGPKYMWPQLTSEELEEEREAIKCFLGITSPVPFVFRYYREQSRLARLARDIEGEEKNQEMLNAGPWCTSEDEMYMQLSQEDQLEYLRQVAEDSDHPDHAAVVAWVNKEPVKVTRVWII